ncbi:hypothetical protein H0H93_015207 [Arthromyces matolae]|nr:hypothetical protein H0H93_015207 [Arthromyces matolae]
MVLLKLSIQADLENITQLIPASKDFEYFFKVKCNSCQEVHPKFVSMNRIEEREVTGGKRESSAKFDATPDRAYTSENGQLAPLLQIECRGLEFIDFDPIGIWKCKGSNGAVFDEVSLEEGEWNDYDEKACCVQGCTSSQRR